MLVIIAFFAAIHILGCGEDEKDTAEETVESEEDSSTEETPENEGE